MVTQDTNDFVFNYRNPKISDGAVGQWAIKIHPLYPGYLLRSYKKKPHLSRKGGQGHSTFFFITGWEDKECEEQQVTAC